MQPLSHVFELNTRIKYFQYTALFEWFSPGLDSFMNCEYFDFWYNFDIILRAFYRRLFSRTSQYTLFLSLSNVARRVVFAPTQITRAVQQCNTFYWGIHRNNHKKSEI
jgi:hypothetical protein